MIKKIIVLGPLDILKPSLCALSGTMPKPQGVHPNVIGYIMPREKENLDWEMVDTDDFTGSLAKAYKAWRAAQDEANRHKETLIDLMTDSKSVQKACPAGEKPRFNFRWGNWYIAFAPMTGKKKASGGFRM